MPTETEFLNGALGKIGASPISSIDEQSQNGRYCKIFYPPLLDAGLRMAKWNFASAQAILPTAATPPLFKWSYAFSLPTDWLRTRTFNGAGVLDSEGRVAWERQSVVLYEISGRQLLSNYSSAYIEYTKRVVDPNIWDSLFYQYLMHMLASQLAAAIPKDMRRSSDLAVQAVNIWLAPALIVVEQENPVTPTPSDSLIWGR